MARRRVFDDSDDEESWSQSGDKRIKRLPSFSTVIKEAITANKLQNVFFAMEPLFRKVVQEELERLMLNHSTISPQRCLQMRVESANIQPSTLKLIFKHPPSTSIFTGSKIEDINGNPLQLLLVNAEVSLELPAVKVELVALDGDFPHSDVDWNSAKFQSNIVKQRAGKRPLLVGDVTVILKNGAVAPELCFTDNSSWTKSGQFRIGARVLPGSYDGPRIKEAITDGFKVKDHRGESYKKHHPPALEDEVWRLVKIAKDGVFHKKLAAHNINTVQDFLKKFNLDPDALRKILGTGMSERTWKATTGHASTCDVGDQLYLHRGLKCDLLLNSVCQVVSVVAGGNSFAPQDLRGADKVYIQSLVREACKNWDNLEEHNGFYEAKASINQTDLSMAQAAAEEAMPLSTDQQNGTLMEDQFGEYEFN
ncbi:protein SAR DEFICIENT 1-like isoform X1 [Canna indica]|uniref:Protein SAR DEFICIENT 1-like isoform X1 n=1 Tax=Canna indica TaxID=4628 RepID=A0AAQ3Q0H0_9LILI|nr:protein SAR DEFICIENT 1-like isoform X1 [Canna indica]